MVPRGGIEPPTLRFSVGERSHHINDLAPPGLEKRVGFGLWMAKAGARTHKSRPLLFADDVRFAPMSGGKADVPGGPSRAQKQT
jgi:hypothetical protein